MSKGGDSQAAMSERRPRKHCTAPPSECCLGYIGASAAVAVASASLLTALENSCVLPEGIVGDCHGQETSRGSRQRFPKTDRVAYANSIERPSDCMDIWGLAGRRSGLIDLLM